MRCPYCATLENKVIDSRLSQGGEVIRRRRECEGCGRRYTTYERVEQALPLVVKKDGRRQPFDRDKILAGLRRSCAKRDISAEALERVVDNVQRAMVERGKPEVPSTFLGRMVLEQLEDLDAVAYVRFASVYREFQDVEEFVRELERLRTGADSEPPEELDGRGEPGEPEVRSDAGSDEGSDAGSDEGAPVDS
ncbi:MAG TPA: transcriptional regulator NrdR [Polyangiaceae bacterium LLY-WYZ-15_(1-7)]|nr:transcriptional regulator NrdR [Sandaracinus sp.]HJL05284.1 transcriptional regulator NrdR [Polyangiaceae bacterium LLY-WYZ-15_(1-7)]HJL07902.1 transcriptional regulator NrdR [Polyangiaceae bacterium LLY-WYZ-15_(1-7)]HJL23441.1 transcriptional regulator NrdR [Polyangiaceae bacterium LLY-WYZ-15_(1-7)]HJL27846.1 transcriptional regulator NrdR [Polyangiaceae bacterium LLY-WYZ-15_(1-7)]